MWAGYAFSKNIIMQSHAMQLTISETLQTGVQETTRNFGHAKAQMFLD
jgi:hypothetical protein